MQQNKSLASLVFIVILAVGAAFIYARQWRYAELGSRPDWGRGLVGRHCCLIGNSGCRSVDRVVILRLGVFHSLKGPGLFFLIPVIDTIPYWIDTRVITTGFKAEKTLTKDTVPVDVDAVLFWKVVDPKQAALAVSDYQSAISWASQTALRDVIGKTMLSDMLEGRDKISNLLQTIIDQRTEPWGIKVIFGRGEGRVDPLRAGKRDVHAGAGRTGAPGESDPG